MYFKINNLFKEEIISLIFVTITVQWFGRTERELLPMKLSNHCLQTKSNLRKKKIKARSSKCLSNDQVNLSKQPRANTVSSFKTQQSSSCSKHSAVCFC